MIEVRELSKKFGDSEILHGVNVIINKGDVIAIIGPSGTGKSTFIRCLNLLNTPTSGQIIVDGCDITAPETDVSKIRQKIGMVFQRFNLFAHLTVLENVMIPQIDILGRSRQEACDTAVRNLKDVGLYDKLLKYPSALSGGQQQRVAIARTLSMDPDIILFDEPTSALDPTLVGEVEYIIARLAAQGRTMVIVTHEMHFAQKVANRVFYMDEKNIYEEGTPDQIFNHPVREKTRRFVSRTRYLDIILDKDMQDIPGIFSQIAVFGDSLDLSARSIKRLQMIFEELCVQTMIPQLAEGGQIHMTLESSEKAESVDMKLTYDPADLADAFESNAADQHGSDDSCFNEVCPDPVSARLIDYAADSVEYLSGEIRIKVI